MRATAGMKAEPQKFAAGSSSMSGLLLGNSLIPQVGWSLNYSVSEHLWAGLVYIVGMGHKHDTFLLHPPF